MKTLAGILVLLCWLGAPHAEPVPRRPLERAIWKAAWISAPAAAPHGPVVMHLRKFVDLDKAPVRFIVHVSADNRFVLHVNGERAGAGPARGDLEHWRYSTLDLAPLLRPGRNLIAATVWNFGEHAPLAQWSQRTAFILQGDDDTAAIANSDSSWQASIDDGHTPNPAGLAAIRERHFFYAASPPERRDGRRYDWDWDKPSSAAGRWQAARQVGRGNPRGIRDGAPYQLSPSLPMLVPDPLPPMEEGSTPAGRVVRREGPLTIEGDFPENGRVLVPARSTASVLLDRGSIINAYPSLRVSGGKNAEVRLHYAESLFTSDGRKGNRDEIEGKTLVGLYDELVADGKTRTFAPLWWRSWRYLQITVTTHEAPVVLEGLDARSTLFPLALTARFESSDPQLARLWDMAFRTLRISAWETYMDSPYWEQLQYIGDTRITALLSYLMSDEDRLARQAITAFDHSRTADGLTLSRAPSNIPQYIPPYALFWIGMLHDFHLYRDDPAFVRQFLPGTRSVLDWFLRRLRADGLLGYIPFWSHVDPAAGGARQTDDGGSAAVSAQLLAALREAATLEDALGARAQARLYREHAARISRALHSLWDDKQALLRDHPGASTFSHDVNILALWQDVLTGPRKQRLADRVLELGRLPPGRRPVPGEIVPASLYFRYYLHRALAHAGRGDVFLGLLEPWREMLGMGLSTFPEFSDPTRSDSHAWTAHPAIDLLTTVAGIQPAAPGFARVRIAPHPGALAALHASVPHRRGTISVDYRRIGDQVEARITLPAGLPGELVWGPRRLPLKPGGVSTLRLPASSP